MSDKQALMLAMTMVGAIFAALYLPFIIEFCIDTFWKIVFGIEHLIKKIKYKIHPPKPLTLDDLPDKERKTLEELLNTMKRDYKC